MTRLLARSGSGADYTWNRHTAIDELEALDRGELETLALHARRADAARAYMRAIDRKRLPVAVRIRYAQAQAKLKGIDIRPQLLTLRRAMEGRRSDACIIGRLEAIERRVFPEPGDPAALEG